MKNELFCQLEDLVKDLMKKYDAVNTAASGYYEPKFKVTDEPVEITDEKTISTNKLSFATDNYIPEAEKEIEKLNTKYNKLNMEYGNLCNDFDKLLDENSELQDELNFAEEDKEVLIEENDKLRELLNSKTDNETSKLYEDCYNLFVELCKLVKSGDIVMMTKEEFESKTKTDDWFSLPWYRKNFS